MQNFQSIQIVSLTPIEHEAYVQSDNIRQAVDQVGNMVMDLLADDDVVMHILLALPNEDSYDEFSLAFSGSTLSLEFSPEQIEVVDFNNGDEETLQVFDRSQTNAATAWLINHAIPE